MGELVCPEIVVDRSTEIEFRASPLVVGVGRISSSDEFVVDPELVERMVASGVRAVDMETSAVAAVCAARGCAWSAVRVISDLVTDHPDAAVLGLANADGSPNTVAALRFMASHPGRIPQLVRLGRDVITCGSGRCRRGGATAPHAGVIRKRLVRHRWRKRSANTSTCSLPPAGQPHTRYPNPASVHFST